MKRIILILSVAFVLYFLLFSGSGGGSIRLRVIANSDSARDQREKMKVVLALDKLFDGATFDSLDGARKWIDSNMSGIEDVCRTTLGERDFKVELCDELYSDGKHESLVVRVGKAEGHNFWGTLFSDITKRCSDTIGRGRTLFVKSLRGNITEFRSFILDKLLKIF